MVFMNGSDQIVLPTLIASQEKRTWYDNPKLRLMELLAGRYRLKQVLGKGAYAVTYRASDEINESRHVVIK
jgi:serine/threonine protein kinase